MTPDGVLRVVQEALVLTLLISAPAVLAAMVVGLLVSVFQAATQIQEQTLTVVPKIVAVFGAVAAAGLWALRELVAFAVALFEVLPRVTL